VLIGW